MRFMLGDDSFERVLTKLNRGERSDLLMPRPEFCEFQRAEGTWERRPCP
jgi:hypothetical protein